MSVTNYLSVDLGATSGRTVLATFDGSKIEMRELTRFKNPIIPLGGHMFWNLPALYHEVLLGLKKAAEEGIELKSIGIDTWGCDFAYFGKDGQLLGLPYCYRDGHTEGAQQKFFERMPAEEVYKRTGIQFMDFNSVFQLDTIKRNGGSALEAAEKAAEDNVETTINYAKYIDAIEDALANLDGAYVIVPVPSSNNVTYWYYIKEVNDNVYLSANESSCDLTEEIEEGNANYLWGFAATGNEGEYKVYNARTGNALYTGTTNRTLLTTDGAADATPYTFTPNEENKALVIESDGKYWYNQRNSARLYRSEGYWKLELAVVKSGDVTSIEEIGAETVSEGIYDLTGRHIEQIVKPGVYVVNGKKTVIK